MHKCYLKSYKKAFKSFMFQNKKNMPYKTLQINPSELYTNSASIIWEHENKEVVHKGILYDIVSIKNNGLTVELILVSDEQEMQLKKQFASMYNIHSNKSTKHPFDLLKSFFSLKYLTDHSTIDFEFKYFLFIEKQTQYSLKIFPVFLSQDIPPPDLTA